MGVVVPAGHKELMLTYRSTYFALGATITLVSLGAWIAAMIWAGKRRGALGRGPTHAR